MDNSLAQSPALSIQDTYKTHVIMKLFDACRNSAHVMARSGNSFNKASEDLEPTHMK